MALLTSAIRTLPSLSKPSYSNLRLVSSLGPSKPTTNVRYSSDSSSKKGDDQSSEESTKSSGGWLDRVFAPSRIHTGTEPHSRILSATEFIYEMHFHDTKPGHGDKYITKYEKYAEEVGKVTSNKAELVGSFRVEVGNQDQFIHLWRHHDGYKQVSALHNTIRNDSALNKLNNEQLQDLVKRESQFMMAFSFWGHPQPQDNKSYYEMRSYVLKPGTMIEWANGWSRGIKHRDNAVAGFFSQIGQLYTVHHIWRYEDLQVRKDVRENAWRRPGWDECVSITVPNIVSLHSRWMSPNKFSPIR